MPPSNTEIYVRLDRVEGQQKIERRTKVPAQLVEIPGSEIKWALHEIAGYPGKDRYAVTHVQSGMQLSAGHTQEAALQRAEAILSRHGDRGVMRRLGEICAAPLDSLPEVPLSEVSRE